MSEPDGSRDTFSASTPADNRRNRIRRLRCNSHADEGGDEGDDGADGDEGQNGSRDGSQGGIDHALTHGARATVSDVSHEAIHGGPLDDLRVEDYVWIACMHSSFAC